jgi:hypothetical protein
VPATCAATVSTGHGIHWASQKKKSWSGPAWTAGSAYTPEKRRSPAVRKNATSPPFVPVSVAATSPASASTAAQEMAARRGTG